MTDPKLLKKLLRLFLKLLMVIGMTNFEEFLDNLLFQPFYWKRFFVAFNSWYFRMTTLTEDDLKNKVPVNKLGIYSLYCDKSQWSYRVGGVQEVQNFWNSINEGYIDMTYEFFGED